MISMPRAYCIRRVRLARQHNQCAITTLVSLANLFGYEVALRSMTRGRASHTMTFSHYERVPPGSGGSDDPFAPAAVLRG